MVNDGKSQGDDGSRFQWVIKTWPKMIKIRSFSRDNKYLSADWECKGLVQVMMDQKIRIRVEYINSQGWRSQLDRYCRVQRMTKDLARRMCKISKFLKFQEVLDDCQERKELGQ